MASISQDKLFLSTCVVGIPKTRLPNGTREMYLATHTSTSRDRRVAESFAEWDAGDAMLLEIHTKAVSTGNADVSWVSKFPGEEETLFKGNGYKFMTQHHTVPPGT